MTNEEHRGSYGGYVYELPPYNYKKLLKEEYNKKFNIKKAIVYPQSREDTKEICEKLDIRIFVV